MMLSTKTISALLLGLTPLFQYGQAQSGTPTAYTDPTTGITFDTWKDTSGTMTFGFAFPSNALTTDATEFIGIIQCPSANGENTGWCGLSLGGPMTDNLLLMAYPYEGDVLTAFKWATGYEMPDDYTGDATLTQISSSVTSTGFEIIYRCQGCLSWSQDGISGGAHTSSGSLVLGWALASETPGNGGCPNAVSLVQHDSQNIFGASLDSKAAEASYSSWAALATKTVTGDCTTTTGSTGPTSSVTTTTSLPAATAVPVPTGKSYDYIVVGAGAGGIPIADRLSQAGHSVLLIERGPVSSGRWGGTMKPDWLDGTNLTRFDVPGLCNEIWVDSAGIACPDIDVMAGCVLGGGTAINAGLWWKPNPIDWDYNFPKGWQSSDMVNATNRVFSRIPGTTTPSMDGQLYYQQGFNIISTGLGNGGFTFEDLNSVPDKKNHTYGHGPFMYSGGERGGPMATYLLTASQRKNFDMWNNTQVNRVVRSSGHVTGLEVQPFEGRGYEGVINVTSITGRVILSSGTFGSARILMRSGIGPQDQLEVVKNSTDGPTMISSDEWINLPVGYNLEDHTNTDTVITHPDVVFYDFYAAYTDPIASDAAAYLKNRTRILTQAAPNIGPLFFDEILGADGITRQLEWTARVEASDGVNSSYAMTMSQYLGRGAVSRGRMTITPSLDTVVSTLPYLHDQNDIDAVIQGIKNLQAALANVKNLTWQYPTEGESIEDFVNNMVITTSNRGANHWIGTSKLGTQDGRQNGGDCVVDLNTKVYGTDNLFVVDASIFPGHVSANPSAYIVTASEHASDLIMALAPATQVAKYGQCGGLTWTGSYACAPGTTCQYQNDYYSQCL